jgi:hypothetical protein
MNDQSYPTAQTLRDALLDRVDRFAGLAGGSRSSIGMQAVGDPKIVHRIAKGKNFTIDVYGRLMAWLDQNWPSEEVPQ